MNAERELRALSAAAKRNAQNELVPASGGQTGKLASAAAGSAAGTTS